MAARICSFDRFIADRGPDAAARMHDAFADVITEEIDGWSGRLASLRAGEAIAVFESAVDAVHAGLALQERFQGGATIGPSLPLPVGIGLADGPFVDVEGTHIGVAVGLADSLSTLAPPGGILASEVAKNLVGRLPGMAVREAGMFDLRGLPDFTTVFRIENVPV